MVYVAVDGQAAGIIALADTLKDFAAEAIEELKKLDVEVIMITGDNEKMAEAMAKSIGIDSYFAKVLPEKRRN